MDEDEVAPRKVTSSPLATCTIHTNMSGAPLWQCRGMADTKIAES